jgi:membrane fusion protein (multidrug efflux system)
MQGEYVFSVDQQSVVKQHNINTGIRVGEQVEVLAGLTAGQQVITKGFLNLKPDMKVSVVSQSVPEPKTPSAPAAVKTATPEMGEDKAHATPRQ